jgi:hypothetical protein
LPMITKIVKIWLFYILLTVFLFVTKPM